MESPLDQYINFPRDLKMLSELFTITLGNRILFKLAIGPSESITCANKVPTVKLQSCKKVFKFSKSHPQQPSNALSRPGTLSPQVRCTLPTPKTPAVEGPVESIDASRPHGAQGPSCGTSLVPAACSASLAGSHLQFP